MAPYLSWKRLMRDNLISSARIWKIVTACVPVFLLCCMVTFADTHTWDNSSGDGLWSTASNWDTNEVPVAGDTVVFDSVKNWCLADAVSNNLAAITLTGTYTGTVVFTQNFVEAGDSITLTGDLTVNGGKILCAGDNDGAPVNGEGVTITAANIFIGSGGTISADSRGFTNGVGPGAGRNGTSQGSGASYGGVGGRSQSGAQGVAYAPGACYGSATAPTSIGSGGGRAGSYAGGAGGGAIKLVATGSISVSGTITCCGSDAGYGGGGGSGGSIWIETVNFNGDGTVRADGGDSSATGGNDFGGGGGGGRIRINYASSTFSGTIFARGGVGGDDGGRKGWPGTFSFPDNTNLTVKGDIALASGVYNIPVLIVTNGAILSFQGDTSTTYGTGVTVNCTTVSIEGGARISADVQGFTNGVGPGVGFRSGSSAGGSSHGGYGGIGGSTTGDGFPPGVRYGSVTAPVALGSGGAEGTEIGGWGAGAIKITASDVIKVDGTICADGEKASYGGSGGSGGSVWIEAGTLTGTGVVSAAGGDGTQAGGNDWGGGAGGGRIRINWVTNTFSGVVRAPGGTGGDNGARPGWPGTYSFPDNTNLVVIGSIALASGDYSLPVLLVTNGAMLSLQGNTASMYGTGVTINSSAITVASGASISADVQGFTNGAGPAAGTTSIASSGGGGGGHGGKGGRSKYSKMGGLPYGMAIAPTALGSGGGLCTGEGVLGGWGGGALKLAASGEVRIDGTVSADGGKVYYGGGGGSGGSVWIEAGTFSGSGTIRADGGSGNAAAGANDNGGGGGGGRIRVNWGVNTFTGTVSAKGGVKGDDGGWIGHPGTYSFPDGNSLVVKADVALVPGTHNIPFLLVTNNSILSCQGDTNSVYGTGVVINANEVSVAEGSSISVVGQGFCNGAGPGGGQAETANFGGGGGGYGGAGGNAGGGALGGAAYGSTNSPVALGSGGGDGGDPPTVPGGWGGGAVKLMVPNGTVTINGAITAEGEQSGFRTGAGSGGSIWINSRRFNGNGTINADGGDVSNQGVSEDRGGGGGGGRVAIDYVIMTYSGTVSAAGGTHGANGGQDGQTGTVTYAVHGMPGTVIRIW